MNRIRSFARTHAYQLTLVAIVTLIAAPLLVVDACGPDFEPDVFTPQRTPHLPARYAQGHLGILQPRYFIAEKVAAYRYLSGGSLDNNEQKVWTGAPNPPEQSKVVSPERYQKEQKEAEAARPVNQWNAARAQYEPAPIRPAQQNETLWYSEPDAKNWTGTILNCSPPSFTAATATLHKREAKWGKASAAFRDWLIAQDAVFSNCDKIDAMPSMVTADAPVLLRQDRDYQTAAALFYRGDYDKAASAFQVIAADNSSPWSRWGNYLAARAFVRKAAQVGVPGQNQSGAARFDPASLSRAADLLGKVASAHSDPEMVQAARAELGFVAIRLKPQERSVELAKVLAGPAHDPEYQQHIIDLRFMIDNLSPAGHTPLLDWMSDTGTLIFPGPVIDTPPRWTIGVSIRRHRGLWLP